MAYRDEVAGFLNKGGISEEAAARICRVANDRAEAFFRSNGLEPMVTIRLGSTRYIRVWREDEIEDLAEKKRASIVEKKRTDELQLKLEEEKNVRPIVAGEQNGGRLMQRISEANKRIDELEDEVASLEDRIATLERANMKQTG